LYNAVTDRFDAEAVEKFSVYTILLPDANVWVGEGEILLSTAPDGPPELYVIVYVPVGILLKVWGTITSASLKGPVNE